MISPPFQKNNRLLVIDDNQAIHADFNKILQPSDELATALDAAGAELFGAKRPKVASAGFAVASALSGEEGLALVQSARAKGIPYALAFVDVRMAPGWDGIETTARIFQADPDIQIVICTAYSDYSWEEMIEKLGQSDRLVILKKPFDTVEVLQLAHALTEKWQLGQAARVRLDQLEQMVAARTRELQSANEQLKIEMAERARTQETLRHAQKMEAVGQLAGGIAHDFNNLISIIRGYVQCLALETHQSAEVREAIREIDVAAERAAKLTSQLLMFSRKKRMQKQFLNLNELLTQFGAMLRSSLGEHIAVELQTGETPLTIHADPVMIEMVILNLAVNSRDAMPQGGRLLIRSSELEIEAGNCSPNSKSRPGKFACLQIEDSGDGIAPEALPHLFEPFFTTKGVGKGTGLGLASAYGIVEEHAGWIEVTSALGRGTTFRIFLPVCAQTNSAPSNPFPPKIPGAKGHETILLVEDEPALRRLAVAMLRRQGYQVYEAASGLEALSRWEEHGPEIDLLFTDMVMPGGLSGRDLARQLREKKRDLKIIYTTGYSKDAIGQNFGLIEGLNFLAKPYYPEKVLLTVRRCLDQPQL